jgi:hypothetical protein
MTIGTQHGNDSNVRITRFLSHGLGPIICNARPMLIYYTTPFYLQFPVTRYKNCSYGNESNTRGQKT